jgi:glycosyltransferase involved in cell wall biosynthesis
MKMSSSTEIINIVPDAAENKVRILIVPGFVVDTYSTIEQNLVELSSEPDPGIEFLWLVPDIESKYNQFSKPENRQSLTEPVWVTHLRHHGIPYVVGNVSKYNVLSNFLLFRDIFRKYRIDAVYTHFGFERFWTAFFGKIWGKVTIWHERWHSLGNRYVQAKRLFYRLFVDEFIAISVFITKTLPRGWHVHTILNAAQSDVPSRLKPEYASELRQRIGVSDDIKIVLMIANFRPEKRHMLALEVCEYVLKRRTDVAFIFLGDGEVRKQFLSRVKSANLNRHVIAPGYVNNVDDYYEIADISILTSHYEPFGNVVLEAMRHSVPVVAFNTGGPAEVIQNGDTGFLVKEGDADEFAQRILDLIEDPQLCTAIGESGRQVVKSEYSREEWIKRIIALLKCIVFESRESSTHGTKRQPRSQ